LVLKKKSLVFVPPPKEKKKFLRKMKIIKFKKKKKKKMIWNHSILVGWMLVNTRGIKKNLSQSSALNILPLKFRLGFHWFHKD